MNKMIGLLCGLLVGATLPTIQISADELDLERPMLTVIEQSRKPSLDPLAKTGSEVVTVTLRNEASEAITAWKVSCLQSENGGDFSIGSLMIDSFLEFSAAEPGESILPGDVREVLFPVKAWHPSQPYAAVHCGVTAVVLADARYAGVEEEVRRVLDARVRMYIEVRKATEVLRKVIDTGLYFDDELRFKDPDLEVLLRSAVVSAKAGESLEAQRVLQSLQDKADFIEEHIPAGWGHLKSSEESSAEVEGSSR